MVCTVIATTASASTFEVNPMTATIHQVVSFEASPSQLYEELTNPDHFAAFSGAPASIDPSVGGSFSLFGGQIVGVNVELVEGERVVQAWRVSGWEPGVFSLVRFALEGDGDGTTLTFDHAAFPPEAQSDLDAGWHAMYWEPIRTHLAS
jgi:activator of HSP90 ATPase